jgi:hypothetical protein
LKTINDSGTAMMRKQFTVFENNKNTYVV